MALAPLCPHFLIHFSSHLSFPEYAHSCPRAFAFAILLPGIFRENVGEQPRLSYAREIRHMVNYERSVGPRDCGGRDEGILSSWDLIRTGLQPSQGRLGDKLMTGTGWIIIHHQQRPAGNRGCHGSPPGV